MADSDSITDWVCQLRDGDSAAIEKLWERYFGQMVTQARRKMEGANRVVVDEEDVALSAFKSFCVAAKEGRFPRLHDRNSLWPLLMSIVAHKSVDAIRHQNRQRRGGGMTGAEGKLVPSLNELVSSEPSPETAAMIADEVQAVLTRVAKIEDTDLQQIALMKLEGFGNDTIANQLGCARRTVERKVNLIRRLMLSKVDHAR